MSQVSNAIPFLQGVDSVIPLYPKKPDGTPFAVGLQNTDGARMELRKDYGGPVVMLMTAPGKITIVPGAAGSEYLILNISGEDSILLDHDTGVLKGTLLIYDSAGNSRPGSGIPVVLELIPSYTRSKSSVGI